MVYKVLMYGQTYISSNKLDYLESEGKQVGLSKATLESQVKLDHFDLYSELLAPPIIGVFY